MAKGITFSSMFHKSSRKDSNGTQELSWRVLPSANAKGIGGGACFAVAIDDHRAMVVGGGGGNFAIYNGQSEEWSEVQKTPGRPRDGMAVAGVDENGNVYVMGGMDTVSLKSKVNIYNIHSNKWKKGTPMPYARTHHGAAMVNGENIVVAGGLMSRHSMGRAGYAHNIIHCYNVSSREWTTLPPIPHTEKMRTQCAVVAMDDTIYVIGGKSSRGEAVANVDAYNFNTNRWSSLRPMSIPRYGHTAVVVGTHEQRPRIVVMGGRNSATAEVLDLETEKWMSLPNMKKPRYQAASIVLSDDRVLIFGGRSSLWNHDSAEEIILPQEDEELLSSDEVDECPTEECDDEDSSSSRPSPFFLKLMEEDKRDVGFKLADLASLIEDVHQAKIYYTAVSVCYRMGLIMPKAVASAFIRKGLFQASTTTDCKDTETLINYKQVLRKAFGDGHISQEDFDWCDTHALLNILETRFRSMEEAIRANTKRIEGLEADLVAVNESVNSIKEGLRSKFKVQAAVGFLSAIINAVSLGIGGEVLKGIVDFSDADHVSHFLKKENPTRLAQYQAGLKLAEGFLEHAGGSLEDKLLKDAANKDDVMVVLASATAAIQEQQENDAINSNSEMFNVISFGTTVTIKEDQSSIDWKEDTMERTTNSGVVAGYDVESDEYLVALSDDETAEIKSFHSSQLLQHAIVLIRDSKEDANNDGDGSSSDHHDDEANNEEKDDATKQSQPPESQDNEQQQSEKRGTVVAFCQTTEKYLIKVEDEENHGVLWLKPTELIFDNGTVTELTGLSSSFPDMEGKWRGTVKEWIEESEEYTVQLSSELVLRVKMENVRL